MYLSLLDSKLLPRGGEGGRAVLEPLFSQEGFCFWDIGNRLRDVVICPERASVRAHTFLPHHHPPPPPPAGGGGGGRRPATNNTTTAANKKKEEEEEHHTTTNNNAQQQDGSPFLLSLSFFFAFEATSSFFAAFVTKSTKPDSVACCFKM